MAKPHDVPNPEYTTTKRAGEQRRAAPLRREHVLRKRPLTAELLG